jgi:hypothetical protein
MNLEPLAAIVEMKGEDLVLSRKCRVTDELVTLTINFKDYRRWKLKEDGVQNIFPQLTPDEREFIQTGYTKAEWAKLFPPEEDEEDEVDLDALAEEQKAHDAYMDRMEMRRPQSERDLEQDLLNRRRPFA